MAGERLVADLLQGMQRAKADGAIYISIKEKSEDMARFYFQKGDLYHVRYGSAIGRDCLDILHYYTLSSASFFEGIRAPDTPAKDLPTTDEVIVQFRKTGQTVKARGQFPGLD